MRSVAVKLVLSFLLVALVGVGSVSLLASRSATEDFHAYVYRGGRVYANQVSDYLADVYEETGGWQGVEPALESLKRASSDRLLILDSAGSVVADSSGASGSPPLNKDDLGSGIPIFLDGETVGTLYFTPGPVLSGPMMQQGRGRAFGGGSGSAGLVAGGMAVPVSPEQDFLDNVNRSVWIAALGAVFLALGLGLVLTYQIVKPLRALTASARRIAQGQFASRVPVSSTDEVGTLATAFNTMAENLEKNERLRRNLIADIVHDLRTPLSIIEGTADGMLDGVFEPSPENIAAIKEESQTLSRLVSDLRELSLAEAGELRLDLAPADLAGLVVRAASRWEVAASEKGVELTLDVQRDLPMVAVDSERLIQVVNNLLSNALRYSSAPGRIAVSVVRSDGELIIRVTDTGSGIAAEDLPYVFERFYRADKSRNRRSGGSGLGLSIVKQLIKAHNGRAWAESIPGEGSKFFVALPIIVEPAVNGSPVSIS